jgi:spermidine/putrescine transport system permease protein
VTQETIAPPARAVPVVVRAPRRRWWRDPWRKPRILQTVTWAYLIWSLVPLTIAIAISFNGSRSNSLLHGFSLQWWWSDPTESLWHDPELHAALFQSLRLSLFTVAISVPLGVAFALGIDRWHSRPAKGFNFLMLLSFVLPEIVLGISLFLVFQHLLTFVELGTTAQILGLVTYQLAYPVIIVRARLLTIGREYEEAASDLGAPPRQAIRRVLLPLLYPAIFASAAIVFADSLDDFVTVRYLSGPATSEPLSVKIYNFTRAEPTPAVNAAATFLLVTTTIAVVLGYLAYRHATRGQRTGGVSEFANV